jgi:hypothetical protein
MRRIEMKIATKLSIAIALALVLSTVSLSVWAAPERQGTVIQQAGVIPVTGNTPAVGGTFIVTILGGCTGKGNVTRIADPATKVGPAATGFSFLTDGIKVVINQACDIQICYPYPQAYADKSGGINKWASATQTWGLLVTTISGNPKQICVIDNQVTDGTYGLIGQ